jgi:hypothetical protein
MDVFMDPSGDGRSIKEEPFEEFLFPETVLQSTTENLVETCCFLCDEGKEILKSINEHFQAYHPGERIQKNRRGFVESEVVGVPIHFQTLLKEVHQNSAAALMD